jgi:hypothetical protein
MNKLTVRRSIGTLAVGVLMLAGTSMASAASVGDVQIIGYGSNAVGADTSANRNSEFVRLRNDTAGPVDVEGWVLHDTYQNAAGDWGNRFTFRGASLPAGSPFRVADADASKPDHFSIPAGADVYVYNGSGVDTTPTSNTASVYRNYKHMWNNGGDTIYLRTSADATSYVAKVTYSPYRVSITQ